MYARALHELIIVRERPPQDFVSHYDEFVEILGNTQFEALQGQLTYVPGQPEPPGIKMIYQVQSSTAPCVGQSQCSTSVNWVLVGIQAPSSSVLDFVAPMVLHFPEEQWGAVGLAATLSPTPEAMYPECEEHST